MTTNEIAEKSGRFRRHRHRHRHKHALLYARVASRSHGYRATLDRQLERCREMARRLDAIDAEEFIDVGRPGSTAERPGLRALLDYQTDTPADYVICSSLQTMGRDHSAATGSMHQILAAGAAVAFADTSTVVAVTTTKVAHLEHCDG